MEIHPCRNHTVCSEALLWHTGTNKVVVDTNDAPQLAPQAVLFSGPQVPPPTTLRTAPQPLPQSAPLPSLSAVPFMSPTPVQAFPTDALELVIPLAPVVTTWLRCATPDGQEETRPIVFAMAFVILESKWERPTGTCDAISSQPDSILQQPQVWQLRHAASLSSIPAVQRHAYAAQPRTYACHVWNRLSCSEALPVLLDIASLPRPTVAWKATRWTCSSSRTR